ncbi:MAG: AbrB/MazE/SpoVT family DNA-binding domain-containing protein [Oscillospiraceae bacterium]|nr:AbrB/MazE/SpoVT family DNA-binding domain-containing protein [Oscillospiraceae bacterium]
MTTTIQKWGNSQAVRLPKAVLESLFLKENDAVEIKAVNDTIVISKAIRKRRAKTSLEERFRDYTGEYNCEEYDWGSPVGREAL